MTLSASNPAKQSPPAKSPTTDNSLIHRERRRDVSAYLVCAGFPCTGFDGVSYIFDDPLGEVCMKGAGYTTSDTIVDSKQFLKELSKLGDMAERWELEHNPPSPEEDEPFVMIPKAFALDESLSAAAIALGVRLAAISDEDYHVYVPMERLQSLLKNAVPNPKKKGKKGKEKSTDKKMEDAFILKKLGINKIKHARAELSNPGYLEPLRKTNDYGQFEGEPFKYDVTPKLRRRSKVKP